MAGHSSQIWSQNLQMQQNCDPEFDTAKCWPGDGLQSQGSKCETKSEPAYGAFGAWHRLCLRRGMAHMLQPGNGADCMCNSGNEYGLIKFSQSMTYWKDPRCVSKSGNEYRLIKFSQFTTYWKDPRCELQTMFIKISRPTPYWKDPRCGFTQCARSSSSASLWHSGKAPNMRFSQGCNVTLLVRVDCSTILERP